MKKYLLTLVTIFLFTVAFTQINQNKIDEFNGFKDVKLGDTFSKWAKYLTKKGEVYSFSFSTAGCCDNAFGFPVEYILLSFDSLNNIKSIQVGLNRFQGANSDNLSTFRNKTKETFGEETGTKFLKDDILVRQWKGTKVKITVLEYIITKDENGNYISTNVQPVFIVEQSDGKIDKGF